MQATAILVDNYDHKSQNEQTQTNLKKALDWEQSFVKFMHNYQKDNNVSHLFDLAFNSERSIEDELGYIHDYQKFHTLYVSHLIQQLFLKVQILKYLSFLSNQIVFDKNKPQQTRL